MVWTKNGEQLCPQERESEGTVKLHIRSVGNERLKIEDRWRIIATRYTERERGARARAEASRASTARKKRDPPGVAALLGHEHHRAAALDDQHVPIPQLLPIPHHPDRREQLLIVLDHHA